MNEKRLEFLAKECEDSGENNLAIVLYTYLGAKKFGMDSFYAEHCQDFARSSIRLMDAQKKVKESREKRRGRK